METIINIHHFFLCSWDYLKITDDNNKTIVFCDDRSGQTVNGITGQYAVISFHTDSSFQRKGYELFLFFFQAPIGKYNEKLTLCRIPSLKMFVFSFSYAYVALVSF